MDKKFCIEKAKGFARFFFPEVCLFCGKVLLLPEEDTKGIVPAQWRVCRSCLSFLPLRMPSQQKLSCLQKTENQSLPFSKGDRTDSMTVYVPFFYERQMISVIHRLKFKEEIYAVPFLAFFLAKAVEKNIEFDLILPIPLSAERLKERGYNQSLLLAREAGRILNKPVAEECLVRTKRTRRQALISDPATRFANAADSFMVSESWDVEGLRVLLVDDVLTTGSTLYFAAKALYSAGVNLVESSAVASGRGGDSIGIISVPDMPWSHVLNLHD